MVGLGAANLAAGLFQGFPVSSSSSRTPVAEAAGSRTQLTGVVGALAVVVILLWASNLLKYVPTAALAGVVISSAIGLIEVSDLRRLFRENSAMGVLAIDRLLRRRRRICRRSPGVGIAVVIAVIEFLWDGWRPHSRSSDVSKEFEGITILAAIPMPPRFRAWSFSAGTRLYSSPTRNSSKSAHSTRWLRHQRLFDGWLSRRARSRASTSLRPTSSQSLTNRFAK